MFRIRQIYNPGWELGADFWPNFRPIGGHSDNSAHSSRQKIIKSGSRYPFDSSLLHRLCITDYSTDFPCTNWDSGGFVHRFLWSIYCGSHNILNVHYFRGQLYGSTRCRMDVVCKGFSSWYGLVLFGVIVWTDLHRTHGMCRMDTVCKGFSSWYGLVLLRVTVWVDLHRTHGISEHVATLGSSSGHALSDNN